MGKNQQFFPNCSNFLEDNSFRLFQGLKKTFVLFFSAERNAQKLRITKDVPGPDNDTLVQQGLIKLPGVYFNIHKNKIALSRHIVKIQAFKFPVKVLLCPPVQLTPGQKMLFVLQRCTGGNLCNSVDIKGLPHGVKVFNYLPGCEAVDRKPARPYTGLRRIRTLRPSSKKPAGGNQICNVSLLINNDEDLAANYERIQAGCGDNVL